MPIQRWHASPNTGRPRPLSDVEFLEVGMQFTGQQKVDKMEEGGYRYDRDNWRVRVRIEGLNLNEGTLCGIMEADVPKTDTPVMTFWSGEIVDNVNYRFRTMKWNAQELNDITHWRKFSPFEKYHEEVCINGGDDIDLSDSEFIFMRWKETHFVNVKDDCGLTIAGFYYLCLDRATGLIRGYYFDPGTVPFQRLILNPANSFSGGRTSSTYSFT